MAFRPKKRKLYGNQPSPSDLDTRGDVSAADAIYNVKSFGAGGDGETDDWGGCEIIKRPEWARKQDMYV